MELMLCLVILGCPGAGKGTQAQLLAQHYGVCYISTGDILRREVKKGSPLGQQAKEAMDQGKLVDDTLIMAMIKERVQQPDCARGYILDGFPRNVAQAKAALKAGIRMDCVLDIKVDDEVVVERLSGRRVHPASGRTYHIQHLPPQREGFDDLTGEPLEQREDDKEEVIRRRLVVFHEETDPVIEFFKGTYDIRVVQVDAAGEVRETYKKIVDALEGR